MHCLGSERFLRQKHHVFIPTSAEDVYIAVAGENGQAGCPSGRGNQISSQLKCKPELAQS